MSTNSHTYVTVSVWYDQSGLAKNATQPTTSLQPRYIPTMKLIDFGNTTAAATNGYLLLPTKTIPANNVPSTVIYRFGCVGNIGTGSENGIVSGGAQGNAGYASIYYVYNKASHAYSQWGSKTTDGT